MPNPLPDSTRSSATPRAEDEAVVRQLSEHLLACWNLGDGGACAALFTEASNYPMPGRG